MGWCHAKRLPHIRSYHFTPSVSKTTGQYVTSELHWLLTPRRVAPLGNNSPNSLCSGREPLPLDAHTEIIQQRLELADFHTAGLDGITNSFGGKENAVSAIAESPQSRRHVMADKEPVAEAAAATKADESKGRIQKSPSEKIALF